MPETVLRQTDSVENYFRIASAKPTNNQANNTYTVAENPENVSEGFYRIHDESGAHYCTHDGKPTKSANQANGHSHEDSLKMGAFDGVLLPCIQNQLGVIFFLRLPSVVGQAGVFYATLLVSMCFLATFTTTLSMCALVTNGKIEAGGPYFIISRNLGPAIGGSLGVLFYLASLASSAMHVVGAVEAFQVGFGLTEVFHWDTQIISLILLFQLTLVVWVGTHFVSIAGPIFLSIVGMSIVCVLVGTLLFTLGKWNGQLMKYNKNLYDDNFSPNFSPDPETGITPTFFSLLSVLFPALSGVLIGSNRASMLRDPARNIPTGTLLSIFASTGLYILVIALFGATFSNALLLDDKLVMIAVSFPHQLIVKVGIIMSSLGSSLQSLLTSSRILSAIATDGCVPCLKWLRPKSGSSKNHRAVIFTWFLASSFTLQGKVDFISPYVAMFILMMYCGINLSCFLVGFLKAPGFRPSFRHYHYRISLAGFLWCLGLAVFMNWLHAFITMFCTVFLACYIMTRGDEKNWGDVGQGVLFSIGKASLLALAAKGDLHVKNWRPLVLSIIDLDEYAYPKHLYMLRLTAQMRKGYGFTLVHSHICGSVLDDKKLAQAEQTRKTLTDIMRCEESDCFVDVSISTSKISERIWFAARHSGLGPLRPNTVLLSWPDNWEKDVSRCEDFFETLRGLSKMKKSVLVFKGHHSFPSSLDVVRKTTIDVWWIVYDGGLLLLLPFILAKNRTWRSGTKLRIFAVITDPATNSVEVVKAIRHHLDRIRIPAEVLSVDFTATAVVDIMTSQKMSHYNNSEEDVVAGIATQTSQRTIDDMFSNCPSASWSRSSSFVGNLFNSSLTNGSSKLKDIVTTVRERSEVRRDTVSHFNRMVKIYSSNASLVVTNLPMLDDSMDSMNFLACTEVMCEGIKNVLFVRGTGEEVITTYA